MTPLDPDMVRELDKLEQRTTATQERLERRVLAVEVVPLRIGVIEAKLSGIDEGLRDLERKFEERAKERGQERKDAVEDRKSNRRWMLGTALATVTLIITAVAVLLQAFNPGT